MTHELTVGANSSVDNFGLFQVPEDELFTRTERLAQAERAVACDLVIHIAEIDRRRAALKRGYNSTFDYCVSRLRYSEGAAYRLIRAARSVRMMPPLEMHLRVGALSLEAIALLHPYLEEEDAAQLVLRCVNLKTRAIEALLAKRKIAPPVRDSVRHIGIVAPVHTPSPAVSAGEPLVLSSESTPHEPPRCLVRVAFAADERFLALLQRAKEVMNNKYPEGRLENILGDALEALLDRKDMDRIVARRERARVVKVGRLARRKAKELAGAKFVSLREQRPVD